MEEEKKRIYTIVTIAILAGVLVSCTMGALAGGLAGFLVFLKYRLPDSPGGKTIEECNDF